MAKKGNYIAEVEFSIGGIPCIIGVIDYTCVKGSYSYNAPSDVDYYGYEEMDWDVLDRKGYRAKWLDYKVDEDTKSEIEMAIAKAMKEDY